MIIEEAYEDPKEISRIVALMCSNQATAQLTNRDIFFKVRFKEIRKGDIYLSVLESNQKDAKLSNFSMFPFDAEVFLGGNVYLFNSIPVSEHSITMPEKVQAHPKRKNRRIQIYENPVISKMYASISMKVVDFSVSDQELSTQIHYVMSTIESQLKRSENYDIAKVTLFDGTEKNLITKIIKKEKKPFVVFDSSNFKVKDEMVLTYEDYIKHLSEQGYAIGDIMAQLDKMKEFYLENEIKGEAIVPLIFEDEAIGQIRVISRKNPLGKPQVRRLITLSLNAVENLFERCSFEIVSKEPQIIKDLSTGGSKFIITEPDIFKYIKLMRRIFIQIFFPDNTLVKTMGTIVNIYDPTPDNLQQIGIKFSANIDWKEKTKLDEFIQSVIRLEKQHQNS